MEFTESSEINEGLSSREIAERFNAEQIQGSVEALASIETLRPEHWERLSVSERLDALQETENRLAAIQHRDAVPVTGEAMGDGTLGYWDGVAVHINRGLLTDAPVEQVVDTVAHEGRHAYQDFILQHPEQYPDLETELAWLFNNPRYGGQYFDAATFGFELYRAQPLEADAWAFGQSVASQLYA